MSKNIGYAVVGLGVGTSHADAAIKSENAQLVAVCDLIEDKLVKFKSKNPDVITYTDFSEMLKNPDIDIVSICVPSGIHADLAVEAMNAGKHVLVEKPIDITVKRAMLIEEARIKTGKIAGVIHQNRNNAVMKPIKEAIDNGTLGKIILGTFGVKWYRDQKYYDEGGWRGTWEMDGGGSLMNQAVHTVDLMQWLMGDVYSVTSTMGIFNHNISTEDLTVSIVKFKSGAVATFTSSTCCYPGISTEIQVYGSNGSIEADGSTLKTWKIIGLDKFEENDMLDKYGKGNAAAVALDPTLVTGHASQVEDIINAVIQNRQPQIVPLEAMKSVRIVNAIYESARTGKEIIF